MAKVIVAKTKLKGIPRNCWECGDYSCTLPTSRRNPDMVLKRYSTKRHKDCPLRIVDEDQLEEVK